MLWLGACVLSEPRLGLKRRTNIDSEDRGLMAPDTKTEDLESSWEGGNADTWTRGVGWQVADTRYLGQGVTHMLSVSHHYNIRVRWVIPNTSHLRHWGPVVLPSPPIYLPQTLTGACHALCHAQCHVTVTLSRTLVSSVSEWGQRCLRVTLRPVDINLFLTVLLNTDTIRDSTWQFSSAPVRPGSIMSVLRGYVLTWPHLRHPAAGECPASTRCPLWHMAFKTRRFQLTFLRESNGFSEWLAFFEYFGHVSGLSVLKALFPFDISTSTMLWLFLGRIWLSWSGLMAILVTPVPNSMLRLVRELSLSTSRTVITAMVTMRMSINKITQQPYLLSCCGQFPLIV